MKRITIFIAAVVVMSILSVSCNNYICPAYGHDTADQEQNDELPS